MKHVYYHYTEWEDYKAGMWRKLDVSEEPEYLDKAIKFTGDHEEYGSWMDKVVDEWPLACEHNLSNLGQNRKAWIGHSACCLAINCPEYITRQAWSYLTAIQQDLANMQAEKVIRKWELKYPDDNQLELF